MKPELPCHVFLTIHNESNSRIKGNEDGFVRVIPYIFRLYYKILRAKSKQKNRKTFCSECGTQAIDMTFVARDSLQDTKKNGR